MLKLMIGFDISETQNILNTIWQILNQYKYVEVPRKQLNQDFNIDML